MVVGYRELTSPSRSGWLRPAWVTREADSSGPKIACGGVVLGHLSRFQGGGRPSRRAEILAAPAMAMAILAATMAAKSARSTVRGGCMILGRSVGWSVGRSAQPTSVLPLHIFPLTPPWSSPLVGSADRHHTGSQLVAEYYAAVRQSSGRRSRPPSSPRRGEASQTGRGMSTPDIQKS